MNLKKCQQRMPAAVSFYPRSQFIRWSHKRFEFYGFAVYESNLVETIMNTGQKVKRFIAVLGGANRRAAALKAKPPAGVNGGFEIVTLRR